MSGVGWSGSAGVGAVGGMDAGGAGGMLVERAVLAARISSTDSADRPPGAAEAFEGPAVEPRSVSAGLASDAPLSAGAAGSELPGWAGEVEIPTDCQAVVTAVASGEVGPWRDWAAVRVAWAN